MLAVIAVGACGEFLQVVWMHFLTREIVILLRLLFVLLVDFGFHINELVAPLLSPTLARGLTLQIVSNPVALIWRKALYLYVIIFVFLILVLLFFILLFLLLLFFAALIVFNILLHVIAGLS